MKNNLDSTVNYRVKLADGSSIVHPVDHTCISSKAQDRIAERLTISEGVLCLCQGQLDRGFDGELRVVPRVKEVGTKKIPELLVLQENSATTSSLVEAVNLDHEKMQRARTLLQTDAHYRRRAKDNNRLRSASWKRARRRRDNDFWDKSRE